ncbi:hypothetical protein [Flavobacterium beibuense]|uniref:Lipoprotein n=1 Tax=Flavobacterium beibuense TaxID=657326 RepID=A0A444WBT3_9FLAO|nr:hypothetical protein [Flavobacterium beibuense]RYJ43278.1 hypothetical protein NU09_1616 [Flavobacterium beibuense]
MKNLKVTVLAILSAAFFIVSCSEEQNPAEVETSSIALKTINNDGDMALQKAFALTKIQDINKIDLNFLKEEINDFTYDNIYGYEKAETNEKILVVENTTTDELYVLKGIYENNKFTTSKKIFGRINLDEKGTGTISADNVYAGVSFDLVLDGGYTQDIIQVGTDDNDDDDGFTLCQREEGEGTIDCYKREADEFCDDWISCAAIATNTTIHLLILAVCSC